MATDHPENLTLSIQIFSRSLECQLMSMKDSRTIPQQWNTLEQKTSRREGLTTRGAQAESTVVSFFRMTLALTSAQLEQKGDRELELGQ